jgi:hypothetical protein
VALVGLSMFSDTAAALQNILQAADSHAPSPLVRETLLPGLSRLVFFTPDLRVDSCLNHLSLLIHQGNAVSACFAASKQRFTFLTPAFSAMDVSEAAKVNRDLDCACLPFHIGNHRRPYSHACER